MRSTLTRLLIAAGTVATLAVGLTSAPANAVVVDTDAARIDLVDLDFGEGGLLAGTPGYGVIEWDVTAGAVTPTADGRIYIGNVGTCARMHIESYDAAHVLQAQDNGATRCRVAGGPSNWTVNLSTPANPVVTHMHLVLQELVGGNWVDRGFSIQDL